MTTRIQIPITEGDAALLKAAARRAGLTLAEWARRILAEHALRQAGEGSGPHEALQAMFALDAPVADVETMISESTEGRYQ
ncbi:hypothetical protein ACFL51_00785 [Myxococcota bacterium]